MILFKKRKAFTLVELMMLLLVASLLVASAMPVITRRHFKLPATTTHGAYMCYYNDAGQLTETLWSGKSVQNEIYTHNNVAKCNFIAPKKASYFQISAIGGGGGGGDSGYRGGNRVVDSIKRDLSPFNRTKAEMEETYFVPEDKYILYAGTLKTAATSLSSTSGGSVGAVSEKWWCTNKGNTKPCNCSETSLEVYECEKDEEATPSGEGEGEGEGSTSLNTNFFSRVASKISGFFKETLTWSPDVKSNSKKAFVTGAASSACSYESDSYTYDIYDYEYTPKYKEKYAAESCLEYTSKPTTCKRPKYKYESGWDCGSGCVSSCSGGVDKMGGGTPTPCTYKVSDGEEEYSCSDLECTGGYGCPGGGEHIGKQCKYTASDGYELTRVKTGSVTVAGCGCGEGYHVGTKKKTITIKVDCDTCFETCSNWQKIESSAGACSGGSGASAVKCTSTGSTAGGFNLTLNRVTAPADNYVSPSQSGNNVQLPAISGSPYCSAATGGKGFTRCADGSVQSSCTPSYATTSINSGSSVLVSVTATSPTSGGGGGVRNVGPAAEGSSCTDSCGVASSAPSATCTGGSSDSGCSSGYLLNGTCGGEYSYSRQYDTNYLQYGEAGSPGVFKTVIVRSLSNIDTTINIGRGGSAATNGQGGRGSNGTATTMGKVITADGGQGGAGGKMTESSILPAYNAAAWSREDFCYNNRTSGTCPTEFKTMSDFKYHVIRGNSQGVKATPIGVASGVLNFLFNTMDNSAAIQRFSEYGRGGNGGGVEHTCWAGQRKIKFEGHVISDTTTYECGSGDTSCSSSEDYAPSGYEYVPKVCKSNGSDKKWNLLPASNGVDGALLIRW